MASTPLGQITFDEFRLDGMNACLWRRGERIPLTPKPFTVLWCLAEHSGQLLTKDELLGIAWPDTIAGEASLTVCIHDLRKILGDRPQRPHFIETVHRRGYRFLPAAALVAPPVTAVSVQRIPALGERSRGSPNGPQFDLDFEIVELQQLHNWLESVLRSERPIVIAINESGLRAAALDSRKATASSLPHRRAQD